MSKLAGKPVALDRDVEYEMICAHRVEHLQPVDQPLVLVSQAPRSGGTLMMRLLDSHPQCHTISHEFNVLWGVEGALLRGEEEAWAVLERPDVAKFFRGGHRTSLRKNSAEPGHGRPDENDPGRAPYLSPPSLRRQIFEQRHALLTADSTERDVADAYFTAYFNAWLDNQNLYGSDKRWVTAFRPRLGARTIDRVLGQIYPDGRLLSVVREPHSWYASARGWSAEWEVLKVAVQYWVETIEETLTLKERLGDRMMVVTFTDLLGQTERTMRAVSLWLDVEYGPTMAMPTFNRLPIAANTSFANAPVGVDTRPLRRAKGLTQQAIAEIDRLCGNAYERVAAVALELPQLKEAKRKAKPNVPATNDAATNARAGNVSKAARPSAKELTTPRPKVKRPASKEPSAKRLGGNEPHPAATREKGAGDEARRARREAKRAARGTKAPVAGPPESPTAESR